MQSKKDRLFLLREEHVSKALLKLGIPTMIGFITSALYNLVDAYFVGQLGKSQMGAVSVVYPLGVIILGIGLLFGSGASSYLARLLGDKRYDDASKCASTALFTSFGIGAVIIVLMLLFLNPLLSLLGATDTIFPYAKEYGILFIIGLLLNIFNITVSNIITAEGATTVSMAALLSGGVINIILDPIFINVAGMGIRGAAIATLLSRCVTTTFYVVYILSGKSVFLFRFKNYNPSKALYVEILKIGIPLLVFQLLISVSISITNFLSGTYGDAAVAASGIVTRIMSFGSMAVFGFIKGYQPFVGYNYGAGNMSRVKEATRIALLWSTGFCVLSALGLILFSGEILAAFSNNDTSVVSIGSKALVLNGAVFIGFGFQAVYSSYFLALGKAKEGGMISVGRQGAFFIPIIFIFAAFFGLNGIITAQPAADFCSIILVAFLSRTTAHDADSSMLPTQSPQQG